MSPAIPRVPCSIETCDKSYSRRDQMQSHLSKDHFIATHVDENTWSLAIKHMIASEHYPDQPLGRVAGAIEVERAILAIVRTYGSEKHVAAQIGKVQGLFKASLLIENLPDRTQGYTGRKKPIDPMPPPSTKGLEELLQF